MEGIENVRGESLFDPPSRYGGVSVDETEKPQHSLDSDNARKLHGKLMNSFLYEKRRQSANRYQMALDHDYYDSIQLTDEDMAELIDRGQPLYVYNLVKRAADWVIGTEKRTRVDFKVLGRGKDQREVEAARNKTDVLKYLSDVNKAPFHRSQAFRESVISGLGWLEDGVRGDPDDEPIYSRKESWRNILHDSHGLELDGTDMRYLYRYKWTDLDVAVAMFSDREASIRASTIGAIQADDEDVNEWYLGNRISGQDYLVGQANRAYQSFSGFLDNSRDRVRLIECWYRMPVKDQIVVAKQLPMFHGQRYDGANEDMRHAVLIGDASLTERVGMGVFYALMTENALLATGRSPYRHNQFPFTPIWCYRRGRDNAPYGLIRPIRDPQDAFNARMRKALFALSAYRVEATSNAIDPKTQSWEDLRIEAGRPDAMLVRQANSTLEVKQDRGLAEGHMKLAEQDASLILDSSGITADNLGMDSNAQSGKAIIAKQSEGSAVTAEIFDNLRFANQLQGEKQLSLAEQYVTDERVVRITDRRGRPSYKKVNEIVQNPDGTTRVMNDITATKSDFVIDQADFSVSLRQAASDQLFQLSGRLQGLDPMIVLQVIDMALDVSNLPDKDELVKRIRSITGYQAPEDAMTPDEQQQQEQAKAQQQEQQQAQAKQQQDAANADLQVKLADVELKKANAEKALAEAERARAELPKGAGVMSPEQQQRWDEIVQAHQVAQDQIAQHAQEAASLQQQLKDRQAEIDATQAAAMHKADQERAAAEHVANKQHDATIATAQLEHAPGGPDQQEHLADVLQSIQELAASVADIQKAIAQERDAESGEADQLAAKVEQIVKAALAAQPKESPQTQPQPAPKHEVHFHMDKGAIHVAPHINMPKAVGKTIKMGDGSQARIEPDQE
jgi:hypothetical protein